MALKIRLRQQGRTNRQTYRLVVTDIRCPRDGKYLEMVGWYNPFNAENNCHVHAERIQYWMGLGAQLTPNAEALVAKVAPHVILELRAKEQARRVKLAAKRRSSKKAASALDQSVPVKEKETQIKAPKEKKVSSKA